MRDEGGRFGVSGWQAWKRRPPAFQAWKCRFKNNCFAVMRSSTEEDSYLRLVDFVSLNSRPRVMKKKKKRLRVGRRGSVDPRRSKLGLSLCLSLSLSVSLYRALSLSRSDAATPGSKPYLEASTPGVAGLEMSEVFLERACGTHGGVSVRVRERKT